MGAWVAINALVLVVVWQGVQLHRTRRATVSLAQCVLELGDDLTTLDELIGADEEEFGWPTADQALTVIEQLGTKHDAAIGWGTFNRDERLCQAGDDSQDGPPCAICNVDECHC